jgi:hypothetical protein
LEPNLEYEFEEIWSIPDEWIEVINQLHPVTAIVVWEVLSRNVSPATIALARSSPDWDRYHLIRIVGTANPAAMGASSGRSSAGGPSAWSAANKDVIEEALQELEEIFMHLMPGDPRRIVH